MCLGRTRGMTVLWPSGGHLKDEGREAAQKQPGEEWWRWNETVLAGIRGIQLAVQLWTDPDGGVMSKPCVPPGTERIKVKVRAHHATG